MSKIILFIIALCLTFSQNTNSQIQNDDPQTKIFLPQKSGNLIVYTAIEKEYYDGIYRVHYAPYKILDESGKLIQKVGRGIEEPLKISLDEGIYIIELKTDKGTSNKLTAKIKAGKITVVR